MCYHISSRTYYLSRHVIFDEHVFPFQKQKPSVTPSIGSQFTAYLDPIPIQVNLNTDFPKSSSPIMSESYSSLSQTTSQPTSLTPDDPTPRPVSQVTPEGSTSGSVLSASSTQPTHSTSLFPIVTRSKLRIVKPNPRYALHTTLNEVIEPSTLKEALTHPM